VFNLDRYFAIVNSQNQDSSIRYYTVLSAGIIKVISQRSSALYSEGIFLLTMM